MSDSEEDQPHGRFSANYSSSEDEGYYTPEGIYFPPPELGRQPSTSTLVSEHTERQIDYRSLRSPTPFSDRNYDSDTPTVSEYSIMAEQPPDAQLITAEEYQEFLRLKQQQTQPPPAPTMQELMERLIVVQEKTASRDSGPRIKIAEPGEFDGNPENLRKFLNECEAYFESVPKATESQKINCALSHMRTGNAWMFAETIRQTREAFNKEAQIPTEEWEKYEQAHYLNWKDVSQALKDAFHERDVVDKAQEKLLRIKQGSKSAEEYILEFERYEINAELNENSYFLFFRKGLSESLLKSISARSTEKNLAAYKKAARDIQKDERDVHEFLHNREPQHFPPQFQTGSSNQQRFTPRFVPKVTPRYAPPQGPPPQAPKYNSSTAPPAFRSTPVPMDVGRARQSRPTDLSKIECFKCHQKGHYARDCQAKIARIIEQKDGSIQIVDELIDPEEDEAAAAEVQEETLEELTSSDFQQDAE